MYVWEIIYPLLHVGVHELPLARLDVHGPASPFVGAADASHGLGLHTAVLVRLYLEHDLEPASVYPLLHVGAHELPLGRTEGHGDATPFVIAADASQSSSQHSYFSHP